MRKFIILISLISILILSGSQQTDKDKLSDSNFQIVSLYWNNAIDWNLICNRCLNEGKDCKSENGLKIRMKVDYSQPLDCDIYQDGIKMNERGKYSFNIGENTNEIRSLEFTKGHSFTVCCNGKYNENVCKSASVEKKC